MKFWLKNLLVSLFSILFFGCKTEPDNRLDKIYNKLFIANLVASMKAEASSHVPTNYFENGDTLDFEKEGVGVYLYGKDSLKGENKAIDPSSIIIYNYKIRNACVFSIYDSLGRFIDKGLLYEYELMRVLYPSIDQNKAEFYDRFILERANRYKMIEEEFSISIDSLLSRMESEERKNEN